MGEKKKKEKKRERRGVGGWIFFQAFIAHSHAWRIPRVRIVSRGSWTALCSPKRISCRISRAFSSGYLDNRDSAGLEIKQIARKQHTCVCVYIYGKLSHPWPDISKQFNRIGQKITWTTSKVVRFFIFLRRNLMIPKLNFGIRWKEKNNLNNSMWK